MDIEDYTLAARKTAMYRECDNVVYPALGLAGEVGELLNKVKKVVRGDYGYEDVDPKEVGDIMWYLVNFVQDMYNETGDPDWNMDSILAANVEKLRSRQERGVIQGDGDDR